MTISATAPVNWKCTVDQEYITNYVSPNETITDQERWNLSMIPGIETTRVCLSALSAIACMVGVLQLRRSIKTRNAQFLTTLLELVFIIQGCDHVLLWIQQLYFFGRDCNTTEQMFNSLLKRILGFFDLSTSMSLAVLVHWLTFIMAARKPYDIKKSSVLSIIILPGMLCFVISVIMLLIPDYKAFHYTALIFSFVNPLLSVLSLIASLYLFMKLRNMQLDRSHCQANYPMLSIVQRFIFYPGVYFISTLPLHIYKFFQVGGMYISVQSQGSWYVLHEVGSSGTGVFLLMAHWLVRRQRQHVVRGDTQKHGRKKKDSMKQEWKKREDAEAAGGGGVQATNYASKGCCSSICAGYTGTEDLMSEEESIDENLKETLAELESSRREYTDSVYSMMHLYGNTRGSGTFSLAHHSSRGDSDDTDCLSEYQIDYWDTDKSEEHLASLNDRLSTFDDFMDEMVRRHALDEFIAKQERASQLANANERYTSDACTQKQQQQQQQDAVDKDIEMNTRQNAVPELANVFE